VAEPAPLPRQPERPDLAPHDAAPASDSSAR
jgi:hypothetical protein